MADGYARRTRKPCAVIVHVDVGTQALGPAFHNAASGRAPVLVLAGAAPFTQEGELKGSRSEFINWYQDISDQRAIVAQYCRYAAEIKTGRNVKQMVHRALQFANSEPQGPVYLMAAREVFEEEVPRVEIIREHWKPFALGELPAPVAQEIAVALRDAQQPLIIVGFVGRDHQNVGMLVQLADLIPGLRVYDSGMTEMSFPATHHACLTPNSGARNAIEHADVILVLDADVPWIPNATKPSPTAKIFHVDADPLKQRMQLFYIPAQARYLASSGSALRQVVAHVAHFPDFQALSRDWVRSNRTQQLQSAQRARRLAVEEKAEPPTQLGGPSTVAYLCATLKAILPPDTIWVSEAVTNHVNMADQLAAELPGTFITKGGSGLGWNGGAALGVCLAERDAGGGQEGQFICNITGDGSYLFSHPSSVAWIAAHYKLPVLTVVLNNGGWRAPHSSAALVSPDGRAARTRVDAKGIEALAIGFGDRREQPRCAGIAVEASAGWFAGERVEMWEGVRDAVERGRKAVKEEQRGCVLEIWIA